MNYTAATNVWSPTDVNIKDVYKAIAYNLYNYVGITKTLYASSVNLINEQAAPTLRKVPGFPYLNYLTSNSLVKVSEEIIISNSSIYSDESYIDGEVLIEPFTKYYPKVIVNTNLETPEHLIDTINSTTYSGLHYTLKTKNEWFDYILDNPPAVIVNTSYNCVSGNCVEISGLSGQFADYASCISSGCEIPPTSYNCVSGNCVQIPGLGGQFATEEECILSGCEIPPTSYNCVSGSCVEVSGLGGEFPDLNSCILSGCSDVTFTVRLDESPLVSPCDNSIYIDTVSVNPPGSPVTWTQLSGRPIIFDDIHIINPTITGITDNQSNTDEIILRISSGAFSTLVPVYTRPTDFIKSKYGSINTQEYGPTQKVDIDLLFTARPTNSITNGTMVEVATSFTFNTPIYTNKIDRYALLINTTGQYTEIQTSTVQDRRFVASTLPAHYKIRAYYINQGVTYYVDSEIRYLTPSSLSRSYLGADLITSKYSQNTSGSATPVAYIYNRALRNINESDDIDSTYSQIQTNSITQVPYVRFSNVIDIDLMYDSQLGEYITSKYSVTIKFNPRVSQPYQYNRGGLIIG